MRPLLRQTLQFLTSHGLPGALRVVGRRLLGHDPPAGRSSRLDPYPRYAPPAIHPFDQTYGVETSGFHRGEDLHTVPAATHFGAALWNTAYYGIAPSIFNRALALIDPSTNPDAPSATPVAPPKGPDWTRFTFIDLGCGKGRALLLASRFLFRGILGVELDPTLAATAQANLRTFAAPWRTAAPLEARHADAATVDYPLTPIVLYLYHPFLAPVLRRVLRHLERSLRRHPRELWLIYINPEADRVLRSFPFLVERARTTLTLEPEDALADRFGSSTEEVAIFHFTPPTT